MSSAIASVSGWDFAEDGTVVAAVLLGDESAAHELFHRYHPRLIRRMAYWTRDRGRVDDLAQDAWLRAMAALDRFDQEAPFWPWLRSIGDNVARSDLRSRLVPSGEERVICIDGTALAQTPAPTDDQTRIDDGASITAALHAIPDRQRSAFLAVAYRGAPVQLAATELGLNENAFRQLYHRARHSLRRQLEGVLATAPFVWLQRWRSGVTSALAPEWMPSLAQGTAAVAGLVVLVVLAPVIDRAGGAPATTAHERPTAVEMRASAVKRHPARAVGDPSRSSRGADFLPSQPTRRPAEHGATERQPPRALPAPATVDRGPVRGDQNPPSEPDYHYGARVEPPGAPPQEVGYQATDSALAPVHDRACEAAAASPVTYCER